MQENERQAFFQRLEGVYAEVGTHSGNPCGDCRSCCSSRGRVTHRVSHLELDYLAHQAGPEVARAFRNYAEGTHETAQLPPFARAEESESLCPNYDASTRGCRVHPFRPFSCRVFGRFQPAGHRLPPPCSWKDLVEVFELERYYEVVPGALPLRHLNEEYDRQEGHAARAAESWQSDDPMDLALAHIQKGERELARRQMRRLLATFGPTAATYRKLAQLHALMDEFDRAYMAFQQASTLEPDNIQDAYYAAQMASLLKRHNACQRWLDRVLERDGQHRDALLLQERELRTRGEEARADEVRSRLDKLPA